MPIRPFNLGILAHVDAGKTSLTERLLFENGAIAVLGSVDGGDTQTDTTELERRRGITIRSAVAPFALGDGQVNLVDTPGHPDFIAEVERALGVLDGAVLVISSVQGVQAQTRVLMRSLRRMRLPTLIFVNKIDQRGAREADVVAEIRRRLTRDVLPVSRVDAIGTPDACAVPRSFAARDSARDAARDAAADDDEAFTTEAAELLASVDDALLARIVDDAMPPPAVIARILRTQTARGAVHPVFFGSATTGAGVGALTEGVRDLMDHVGQPAGSALRGTVFAIDRTAKREKIAYLRMFSGTVRERQRVTLRRANAAGGVEEYHGRIAGLEIVRAPDPSGPAARSGPLTAGNIGRVRGLPGVRVGDRLGDGDAEPERRFSPPILESVVRPGQPGQEGKLHAALSELADEDPLIRVRTAADGATSVLLYGVVQKEVIAERLGREFGVHAVFGPADPVYFERPVGRGEAVHEFAARGPNEHWQTLGLRVEPTPASTGNVFVSDVEWGLIPKAYHRAIEEAATATLRQGLFGWEVTGAAVTVIRVGFNAPMTDASDFRQLASRVLMRALGAAGSAVHEPGYSVQVEAPEDALREVVGFLVAMGAELGQAAPGESTASWTVQARIPARLLPDLAVAVPGLTRGEGAVWYEPGADSRVRGTPPTRARTDGDPLAPDRYTRFLVRHGTAGRPR